MIAHVILFSPRADLSDGAREDLLGRLTQAAASIPSIRRFRVGPRIRHGRPGYEQMMQEDFQFAAILEFDSLDDLTTYLAHADHQALGDHFTSSAARSLAYDYDLTDLPTDR